MKKRVLKGINIFFTGLFALSVLSPYVDPNLINISIFGLMFPFVLIPLILLIPINYRLNRPFFIALLVLTFFGLYKCLCFVQFNSSSKAAEPGFTIMSYNMMIGARLINNQGEVLPERRESFIELLTSNPRVDVFFGQELGKTVRELLAEGKYFPHEHSIEGRSAAIYSSYPITAHGEINIGSSINSCLWADLVVTGDTVRVYSVHLESNKLRQSSFELLTDNTRERADAINGISDLVTKYVKNGKKRSEQAKLIDQHASKSPYPVIMAGDFNEGPNSFVYRILKRNFEDAFMNTGKGIGSTWNGFIPFLRIDHILYSPLINNHDFHLTKTNLSDHYPIKATFTMK